MQELILVIRKQISHWIEHNNEHAEKFQEWAAKAEGAGFKGVSERLQKASSLLREASRELEAAYKELETVQLV
ncbi:MAG: hypothetical protein RMK30_05715 [Anaerolineae bacterium]|nr:hypothetical protein [Anaerolineae bacterium]MDW8102354.1 hypothetical protein [Anaerolineae bacterium]